MTYYTFKNNAGELSCYRDDNKLELMRALYSTQNTFDRIFEEIKIQQTNVLPCWLFGLFDKFVRIIENKHWKNERTLENLLDLRAELELQTIKNLGKSLAIKLGLSNNSMVA